MFVLIDRDYTSVGPSGEISIFLSNGLKSGFGSLAHELKHAYQFEMGMLSLNGEKDGSPLYDLDDELDAYKRGELFGQISGIKVRKLYIELQKGPIDITNSPLLKDLNQEELQNYATKKHVVFLM